MEKFMKKLMIWVAIILSVVALFVGVCFGKVIEGTLFAEIMKWIVMSAVVIGIIEGFIYIAVGPLWYHFKIERKDDNR